MASKKRRTDCEGNPPKRIKLTSKSTPTTHVEHPTEQQTATSSVASSQSKVPPSKNDHGEEDRKQSGLIPKPKNYRIQKLAPPKPFPSVAPSASATGPRSAQKEGKNYICLTRKTSLSTYMRRCKDLLLNDGYESLHLHAMGAAIPLLLQLSSALPPILPFARDEIHMELFTDTIELQDEIIPDDEEEDNSYRVRGKSTLYVIIKIRAGKPEKVGSGRESVTAGAKLGPSKTRSKKITKNQEITVYEEPEQQLEDI